MREHATGGQRVAAVAAVVMAAPVCAEFLVAYLEITGDLVASVFAVAFFVPLYGGAALLIREVSVRTGRGWPGRLLLAAAFGVAMTALIDLSLWMPNRPEIEFWDDLQSTTFMAGLGFSAYAALVWVLGHVLMSVATPLALVESFAPALRPKPWLGPLGLVLWTVAFVAIAASIHISEKADYGVHVRPEEYLGGVAAVVVLVGLAFSSLGRPRPTEGDSRVPGLLTLGLFGAVGMACLDFAPFTWAGVVGLTAITVLYVFLLWRWSGSSAWRQTQVVALVWGALLGHVLIGFASPIPEGVSATAKILHTVVLTCVVIGVGILLQRRLGRRC